MPKTTTTTKLAVLLTVLTLAALSTGAGAQDLGGVIVGASEVHVDEGDEVKLIIGAPGPNGEFLLDDDPPASYALVSGTFDTTGQVFCWHFDDQEWVFVIDDPETGETPPGCKTPFNVDPNTGLQNATFVTPPRIEGAVAFTAVAFNYTLDDPILSSAVDSTGWVTIHYEDPDRTPIFTAGAMALDGWEPENTLYAILSLLAFAIAMYHGWAAAGLFAFIGVGHAVFRQAEISLPWSLGATILGYSVGLTLHAALAWFGSMKQDEGEMVR